MSAANEFQQLIESIVQKQQVKLIIEGKVAAVDKDNNTCDVGGDDMPTLFKVRLNAVLQAGVNVITIYPTVGSKVLCGIIENNPNDAFILACNEIDEIIINGGENGGFTITPALVENLEKNNQILQALLDVLTGAPITEPGNGAPSALQASLSGALAGKSIGDFSEIENDKIKH